VNDVNDVNDPSASAEALDVLLCSRPRGLTPERVEACLPRREVNPDWVAKRDAGQLSEGLAGLAGSMRQVWPDERLSVRQARWVLALREHMSWRELAGCVLGDDNQILGMDLEEAARRALGLPEAAAGSKTAQVPGPQTYLVTRHPGARDWADEEGIAVDALVDHLDVTDIQPGDRVIGSLPVNLAAQVCERGGRYLHLSLELPPGLRGRELSADDMRRLGVRVEEFHVLRLE
jgi:CRISPR-associated protein Csx16